MYKSVPSWALAFLALGPTSIYQISTSPLSKSDIFSSVSKIWEFFLLLESVLTFSAFQIPPYPSRLQVLLVELNCMPPMTKKVLRPAPGFCEVHCFPLVEILSSSSREFPTREPSLFMPLLALLNCVLLMCVIVLMLGLLC